MIKHTLLMLTIVGSLVWISSCSVEDIVEDAVNDVISGCDDGTNVTCDDGTTTITYLTCIDTGGTSLTYDGNTYDCGTDALCTQALADLVADACGS